MHKVLLFICGLFSSLAQAAVVLQYHHVSETSPRVTSVTPAEFRSHMEFLAKNGFEVVPLTDLITQIKRGETPPLRAVAISFDDGYQNIADNAVPILKEYGFPYTLFVSIAPMMEGHKGMMSEVTLKQLAVEGAEIANHSYDHGHLVRLLEGEDEAAWLLRIKTQLLQTEAALTRIRGESTQPMLAYPFGEYNAALQSLVEELGMVAFGQQSGALGQYSSLTALPRFPVGGRYASLETLKEKLYSLPMPVATISPADPLLLQDWQPRMKVTLAEVADINKAGMRCFLPNQEAVSPRWLDDVSFEVQADKPLPPGRSRYNCTAPSKTQKGFYWLSQAWLRPNQDGSWPKEP